jgi:hypothetical protein
MDLSAYGRALRSHPVVVVGGIALAIALAVLSYYRVSPDGLTPRKAELWQSQATVFVTENGFPAGRRVIPTVNKKVGTEIVPVPAFSDPSSFAGLASLYATLAGSDRVRARILASGPIEGSYQAASLADTSFGREEPLPVIAIYGKATTPEAAERTTGRALKGLIDYLRAAQSAAGIPPSNRTVLQVLNEPEPATLVEGRKKTLPIAVFLAVTFAAVALVLVLDNARRTRLAPTAPVYAPSESMEETPAPVPATLQRRRRAPGSTLR